MLNKKDKNSKWRLSRMMYLIFTMIALLNIVVFPSISLFPFMWIPLLGAMVINIFINSTQFANIIAKGY